MSRINSGLARIRHRVLLAYHVRCAREDAKQRGLRVPLGIWVCGHCRALIWDRRAFLRHVQVHAA